MVGVHNFLSTRSQSGFCPSTGLKLNFLCSPRLTPAFGLNPDSFDRSHLKLNFFLVHTSESEFRPSTRSETRLLQSNRSKSGFNRSTSSETEFGWSTRSETGFTQFTHSKSELFLVHPLSFQLSPVHSV